MADIHWRRFYRWDGRPVHISRKAVHIFTASCKCPKTAIRVDAVPVFQNLPSNRWRCLMLFKECNPLSIVIHFWAALHNPDHKLFLIFLWKDPAAFRTVEVLLLRNRCQTSVFACNGPFLLEKSAENSQIYLIENNVFFDLWLRLYSAIAICMDLICLK